MPKRMKRPGTFSQPVGAGEGAREPKPACFGRPGPDDGCCAWSSWSNPQAQVCLACGHPVEYWPRDRRRERFGWVPAGVEG